MKRLLLAITINMFLFSANFACAMVEESSFSHDQRRIAKAPTWEFLKGVIVWKLLLPLELL